VNTICLRNTPLTESFALQDPENKKIVTENKDCANLFAKTFREKVERLIEQVGSKDAMVNEINENFPYNQDN